MGEPWAGAGLPSADWTGLCVAGTAEADVARGTVRGIGYPLSGHDLRFGVGVHETTFRVNVRWVTPLGAETASTS
jgi:hypothetical protein